MSAALDIMLPNGVTLHINGKGGDLDVEIEGNVSSILRAILGIRKDLHLVRSTTHVLAQVGFLATVRFAGRTLCTAGRGIRADALASFLDIPHVRFGRS